MAEIGRIFQPPAGGFFLFGPRGVGKSTWLRSHFADAIWIDLLAADTYRRLLAGPERLLEILDAHPGRPNVVIDEVQKVPALLDVVHQVVESKRPRRFILTGSSARKLRRGASNLLAGRLTESSLHPFMACELGRAFRLDSALTTGLVPLVWSAPDREETLRSYLSLYLKEEVQAEGLVRSIGDFSRFLEAISFSHGSQLNMSAVARECEVSRKTVEGYVQILEDLLLSFRVPVFSKRAQRHLAQHPKFFIFDTGVFRALRPKGPLDRPEEIDGAALEGMVAQHLFAMLRYRRDDCQLYYWRTKSGTEVDFVIYGSSLFWAIEVKRAVRVNAFDVKPLRSFMQDYPEAETVLVYLGKERLVIDGVRCEPVTEFLLSLTPDTSKLLAD